MRHRDDGTIVIFAGWNLAGHLILNRVIPFISETLRLHTKVYITAPSQSPKAKIGPLINYSFYDSHILKDIYKYLDTSSYLRTDGELQANLSPQQLSKRYSVDFEHIANVNEPSFVDKILEMEDVKGGLSIRNFQIFKPNLIDALSPKGFFWNLHPGLIPGYRGLYIPLWAYQNGETQYGWSLHNVDEGIDTGDLISYITCPIDLDVSLIKTYTDAVPEVAQMICAALLRAFNGERILPLSAPMSESGYYSYPALDDLVRWEKSGVQLIGSRQLLLNEYEKFFSTPNTPHAAGLQDVLVNSIVDWEKSRIKGEAKRAVA